MNNPLRQQGVQPPPMSLSPEWGYIPDWISGVYPSFVPADLLRDIKTSL